MTCTRKTTPYKKGRFWVLHSEDSKCLVQALCVWWLERSGRSLRTISQTRADPPQAYLPRNESDQTPHLYLEFLEQRHRLQMYITEHPLDAGLGPLPSRISLQRTAERERYQVPRGKELLIPFKLAHLLTAKSLRALHYMAPYWGNHNFLTFAFLVSYAFFGDFLKLYLKKKISLQALPHI